jgi:pimeloyl-ACP methyl ester carboxylesterase
MAYLAVADDRKIYFEHYPGKGLPVLLIHGWGMSCRIWDTTLVALQDAGHAVVSFDQRGCGSSDKDFPEISIEQSAADAAAHSAAGAVRASKSWPSASARTSRAATRRACADSSSSSPPAARTSMRAMAAPADGDSTGAASRATAQTTPASASAMASVSAMPPPQ